MWIIPRCHDQIAGSGRLHRIGSVENDRLIVVGNRFVLEDFLKRLRENSFLNIASDLLHVFNRIARFNADHALINDGALVQRRNHVVRRRTDQFHAALISQFVRLGPDKTGQERVMDIDDGALRRGDEIRR